MKLDFNPKLWSLIGAFFTICNLYFIYEWTPDRGINLLCLLLIHYIIANVILIMSVMFKKENNDD